MKSLLLLLACIALVAAQQGEKGQKGEPGQAGAAGAPGIPGVCSGSCTGGGVRKKKKLVAIMAALKFYRRISMDLEQLQNLILLSYSKTIVSEDNGRVVWYPGVH